MNSVTAFSALTDIELGRACAVIPLQLPCRLSAPYVYGTGDLPPWPLTFVTLTSTAPLNARVLWR